MPYLNFNSAKPLLKLTITLMTIITFSVIIWFVGILISRIFFQLNVQTTNNIYFGNLSDVSLAQLKYYRTIQIIGGLLLPGIFLQWLFSTPNDSFYQLKKPVNLFSALLILITVLLITPFVFKSIEYNQNIVFPEYLLSLKQWLIEKQAAYSQVREGYLQADTPGGFILNILLFGFLPAIGLEFLFRGVLQKVFIDLAKNVHYAIILCAILYGVLLGRFFEFIPNFIIALLLGYIMLWSKNIWLCVLFNTSFFSLMILKSYLSNKLVDSEFLSTNYSLPVVLASIVLTVLVLIFIRNREIRLNRVV